MAIAQMTMSSNILMIPTRKRIRMAITAVGPNSQYKGTRWKPTTSTT
jgi:hypothetical protein